MEGRKGRELHRIKWKFETTIEWMIAPLGYTSYRESMKITGLH